MGRPLQMLQQANALMTGGHPDEAARLYDELAQLAEARALPQRAARLNIQAARAWLAAGDAVTAVRRAERGLEVAIGLGYGLRAGQIASRLITEMRARGYAQAADELSRHLQAQLSRAGIDATALGQPEPSASRHGSLPARCSACGAPLRPDEVDWVDATSAECPYCGTIVKTTA